jgi:hypothetical protein
MLNEREGKASKVECWQGRREWNVKWKRRKAKQRSMLVRAEGMEFWMRLKERPGAKENAAKGGGMECWMREKERPAKENADKGG